MESYEDDDDTHFCIKCHLTIHGLENYVRHRQSGCRPPDDKNVAARVSPTTPASPTTVFYPEILNADAFFSSLELRSSSKSNTRKAAGLLEESRKFKKEDKHRKKSPKGAQVDNEDSATVKEKLHNMLPGVAELDDPTDHLCMPKRQDDAQRMEHHVHQTWLEDTILAELVANNENKELGRYEFEYQQDDDSEDDMLEEDLGEDDEGGSYSESDDGEDRQRPPRGHIGGKWKPELDDLPQNMSQLQDDDAEPEDEHQEHPPPTYTGGKWRPSDASQTCFRREEKILDQKAEEYETKSNVGQPSPGHTRGKWVPGAQTDIESGYWCSPCGRKLASRLVYNRHLLSDLHARRSIREIDDVLSLPRAARLTDICARCIGGSYRCTPCDFWCEDNETMDSHLLERSHRDVVSMMNGSVPIMIGRQRALPCASCDRRFRYNLQLRLHVRESGHEESLTATDEYQQRIKCNLCPQIVRSLVALQRHQLTAHVARGIAKKDEGTSGTNAGQQPSRSASTPYFCSFCSMNFATAQDAVLHRRTSSHKEIVKARKSNDSAAMSTTRECPHCKQKQANLFEHKKHLLDQHPELCHRCPKCGTLFALSQDVTRHTRENKCHGAAGELTKTRTSNPKDEWKCGSCSFSSNSQAEFIFHGALHAGAVRNDNEEDGNPGKSLAKYSCPICKKAFAKVSLRNHIRSHTGERPFPCAKCLVAFSRRSDLNAHQKECTGSAVASSSSSSSSAWTNESGRKRCFSCSECNSAFYTNFNLFNGPICKILGVTVDTAKNSIFSSSQVHKKNKQPTNKHSLRQHMLRHAGKNYKCGLPGCPTVLRTASELRSHRSLVHDSTPSNRQYKCSDCSYAAKTKTQLRRHRARHDEPEDTGKSELRACPYSGCAFKTKLASHLQRHVRLHTGTKPYKCRHCPYASNNLSSRYTSLVSNIQNKKKTPLLWYFHDPLYAVSINRKNLKDLPTDNCCEEVISQFRNDVLMKQ
ncbi:hypothetical protein WN51_12918 [Melipona quadrifasciata]|uniref:C2H2-type domain-containing protein n=1 Tax=Melipona quadrifasciata TaxID=166423 RepID=A0A0M9AA99_9HYME|nr:hypothetical protein WN51_12918 [Melipona quadrifasciata]